MLISKQSLLRRVPKTVPTRTVLFLDGIRYSIEIIDLAFHRLQTTLEKISEQGNSSQELNQWIVEAMSDAWNVVDSTHRLRGLIQQMPGLKKKQPDVELFSRNTKNVETLRHFVQHLNSGIDSFVAKRMPLWGTLMWSRICPETQFQESHTIVPGTFYHEITAFGCIFDTYTGKFIDCIVLQAGDVRLDLAMNFERVVAFSRWFEKWYARTYIGNERHGADIHFKFSLQPIPSQGGKVSKTDND